MPSLIDIRRRVRAVNSTQQITKAMKMVSSSKLRRAQERILRSRPFAQQMLRVFNNLASHTDAGNLHVLLQEQQRPATAAHRDHRGSRTRRQLQRQRHQGRGGVHHQPAEGRRARSGAGAGRPQGPRLLHAPRLRRALRGSRPLPEPEVGARAGDREHGDQGIPRGRMSARSTSSTTSSSRSSSQRSSSSGCCRSPIWPGRRTPTGRRSAILPSTMTISSSPRPRSCSEYFCRFTSPCRWPARCSNRRRRNTRRA